MLSCVYGAGCLSPAPYTERIFSVIDYYFGLMGSGKTTVAAYLSQKAIRKGRKVFSTVPIAKCYKIDVSDIGMFDISNSLLIIDEAGIDFNNRFFRLMKRETIQFLKLSRHYCVDIVILSQSHEDVDITFKRLADRFIWVKRGLFGFTRLIRLRRFFFIQKDTHQLIDGFKDISRWSVLFCKRVFRPFYYRFFHSWHAPELPECEFDLW